MVENCTKPDILRKPNAFLEYFVFIVPGGKTFQNLALNYSQRTFKEQRHPSSFLSEQSGVAEQLPSLIG